MKHIIINGIRGLPAAHGGFETFAEYLSLYLIEHNWSVTVYCQEKGKGKKYYSTWNNIDLVHIPINGSGKLSTVLFDFFCIVDSIQRKGAVLTLGYNTAIFNIFYRIFNKKNIINMDGIEWKRKKWGVGAKIWFWCNEKLGSWFGNHLIADHPDIKKHLARNVQGKKITMIPYGADEIKSADIDRIAKFGLSANSYAIVIARPEPENSIFEIVKAFSNKKRNYKLVVLGNFDISNPYHNLILNSATENVLFPGAIYDKRIVSALRYYARCYVHGHQVGGTNPSLVEALGASNAIIAHDNKFNKWVAQDAALYFSSVDTAEVLFDRIFSSDELVQSLKDNAKRRFKENFTWDQILSDYEELLLRYTAEG